MKNFILLLFIFSIPAMHAQRKPKIKGNKNVIEVQESLPPFNAIELKDDLEIHLQNSAEEGYNIKADENLIDVLKFKVEDGTLVISSFYKITSKKKLDITINYNDISALTLYDGRVIANDVLTADELFVNTYESSNLELTADAQLININMEGNSSGDFNLNGTEVNFVLKDRIDVRVYTVSELNNIKMYKNASVKMEGTTTEFHANLFESSSLNGEKLEADKIFLISQDSASAKVNALSDFELSSSGSSKTYLYGNPKVEIIEFLDTSELHKEQ